VDQYSVFEYVHVHKFTVCWRLFVIDWGTRDESPESSTAQNSQWN